MQPVMNAHATGGELGAAVEAAVAGKQRLVSQLCEAAPPFASAASPAKDPPASASSPSAAVAP